MQHIRLTVAWVQAALIIASKSTAAPAIPRDELDLSLRPIFSTRQDGPRVTFSDANGHVLGWHDDEYRSDPDNTATASSASRRRPQAVPSNLPTFDDTQHYIQAAIAEIMEPSLDASPSTSSKHPQATWTAPMISPGVFAPIPHIEQTIVTIITSGNGTVNGTGNTTVPETQQSSTQVPPANNTFPADSFVGAANVNNSKLSTDQNVGQGGSPVAPQNSSLQVNVSQAPAMVAPNALAPLSPPSDVQVAKPPAPLDDDNFDDAKDDWPGPPQQNTSVSNPVPSGPATNTTLEAASNPPPPLPPAPQRRGMERRKLARTESAPPSSIQRRAVIVDYRRAVVQQDDAQTSPITDKPGCRGTLQALVPVTHTELYEIRSGRLDPAFRASAGVDTLAIDERADEAECGAAAARHHHLILVPVSEAQLAHIESGMLQLQVSGSGQIILTESDGRASHNRLASARIHGASDEVPMVHFYEHSAERTQPMLEYRVIQPLVQAFDKRDSQGHQRAMEPLVRRVLESHGLDAKLVGNGENKTYHGRVIHNAGDGPYEDSHTIHLDSAVDHHGDTKPAAAADPKTEPAPKPVDTAAVVAAAPRNTDKGKDDAGKSTKDGSSGQNQQGKKDKKKKNKDKDGKSKGPSIPPATNGSPAPLATAPSSGAAPLDDDHDGDDAHEDANSRNKHGSLAYWDGHSDPSRVAEEMGKGTHNAATASLHMSSGAQSTILAVLLASAIIAFL